MVRSALSGLTVGGTGHQSRFDWELPEQYALIHRLQPACLVGNNHHQTPFAGEDIQIFERDLPGENTAGLSGTKRQPSAS